MVELTSRLTENFLEWRKCTRAEIAKKSNKKGKPLSGGGCRSGGGLMVGAHAIKSNVPSYNPAKFSVFYFMIMLKNR